MFDKEFRTAPFIRVLLPLAGGIILTRQFAMPAAFIWILLGFLFVVQLLLIILSDRQFISTRQKLAPRHSLLACIFQSMFLCLGLILGRDEDVAQIPETMFQARICDEIVATEKTFKTRLDRIYYRSGDKWISLDGQVQVYFEKEDRCKELLPGSCISASGRLMQYEDPENPFEFNYGAYQQGRGVYYRLYLDRSAWTSCPGYAGSGILIRSKLWRLALMRRIGRCIRGDDEKAILYSLLLGYRDELGPEVKQHFVRSGVMHILAVSGLHVGILYILPAFLIGKIRKSLTGRILATVGLLSLLWCYAMLTGLSPSVVRAVTMCSVHRMAILLGRRAGIFHVLSLTALIMILSRPGVIFETGFQLSFAAVAGIASFHQPIFRMIRCNGWLGRRIWQIITISTAAQMATAPLSIFYFHQFSNVFILANLVVIPLVTIILYTGLGFFLLSFAGLNQLSIFLEWFTSLLNGFTDLLGRIPGAFTENLSLSPIQVLLLYLLGIQFCLFLHIRRVVLLQILMVTIAMLLFISSIRECRVQSHEKFYVFAMPGESAISFVRQRDHIMYRGGRIRGDTLQVPYALGNFCIRHKLTPPVFLTDKITRLSEQSGINYHWLDTAGIQLIYTVFKDRKIVILRHWPSYYPRDVAGLETDILVLVDNVACDLSSLLPWFQPSLIITDGSNRSGYHEEVDFACMRHRIPFHSTEKHGFYVY